MCSSLWRFLFYYYYFFNIIIIIIHLQSAGKINEAVSGAGHPVKNCIDHTLWELNQRIRDMHCHFSPHLEEVLKAGDGRQRRHSTLEDYERSWVAESETVARDPSAETPLKHAKCAEVLMLFTHHVLRRKRNR